MQTNGKSAWENIKSLFQSPNGGIKEMAEWIPYIDLTAEGYLVMRDRRYQNMVQIESHDLNTLTESDKNRLIEEFSRFFDEYEFSAKVFEYSEQCRHVRSAQLLGQNVSECKK